MSKPTTLLEEMLTENDCRCPIFHRYFKDILQRKTIEPNDSELQAVIKELGINYDTLEPNLQSILPPMIIYYMKLWPGWLKYSDYVKGELKFGEFYSKFKQYITFKLNNAIKNVYSKAYESFQKEKSGTSSEIAPFSIKIEGPASLRNSLIFVSMNDDALIKRHCGPPLKLSFNQLLNWPCVEYEVIFPDMIFIRRNINNVNRFLSAATEKVQMVEPELIESAKILNPNLEQLVVKAETLKGYFDKYMAFIKEKHPLAVRETEWKAIFDEFLQDIKDIKMEDTIATNTAVAFNIGQCQYIRSKKVKAEGQATQPIKFYEVITPRVEIILKLFTAKPVITPNSSLDFVTSQTNQTYGLPYVTYKCTFCPTKFALSGSIVSHLEKEHGMEQVLYCLRCHQICNVTELVLTRWQHNCVQIVDIS